MNELIKITGKTVLKGAGKIIVGAAVLGLGKALATALQPVAQREGKELYKFIYGEEAPSPRKK